MLSDDRDILIKFKVFGLLNEYNLTYIEPEIQSRASCARPKMEKLYYCTII